MPSGIGIVGEHLRLTGRLFLRYGLILTAIMAAGTLLTQLLLRLAAEIGLVNRLLGLVAIAPVILLQLIIFVIFFVILRNGLPRMRLRRMRARQQELSQPELTAQGTAADQATPPFVLALMSVLIPFYGYYAGWGLLGDTLRSYSQVFYVKQIERIDFDNPQPMASALEIGSTFWVVLAVALIWVVRRIAKARSTRNNGEYWSMLVVACEATWALLGLYVLSGWKSRFAEWLASLPSPSQVLELVSSAAASALTTAAAIPVDWPVAPQPWPFLVSLFWYALLPLIWFNLGAIVYGHNIMAIRSDTDRLAGGAIRKWQALPKPVTDFIGHFWIGLIKRWHAVTNGVLLAASAGVALTISVLVAWRLVDWLGHWGWIGMAHLIGPQDTLSWQVLAVPLNVLFGAPGGSTTGLLVSPLQFCILAAGLELAGKAQDHANASRATEGFDAEPA